MDSEILRLIESPELAIPPAPMVALKLQEIIGRENYGGSDIVEVVETDAALSASILRYANSASRGGRVEVTELPAAVARVGLRAVAQIALAKELGRSFGAPGRLSELRSRLWQRSLVSAFVCQLVARSRGMNADQAFTAGLLHDFGAAIVLAAAESVLADRDGGERPADSWFEFAMENHLDVGRLVADDWELGDLLRNVMVHHHEPQVSPEHRSVLELILMSDRVCNLIEQHVGVTEALLMECVESAAEAQLIEAELPKLANRIELLSETARPNAAVASAVAHSNQSTLDGEVRSLSARIEIIDGAGNLQPAGITCDGLVVLSDQRLPPNTLTCLSVEPASGEPFELWCNATLIEKVALGIRIEFRPFALSGAAKRNFESLFESSVPLSH